MRRPWASFLSLSARISWGRVNKTGNCTQTRFEDLCSTKTSFISLNLALKRMGKNKKELLLVLERPDLPLHNNLSDRYCWA